MNLIDSVPRLIQPINGNGWMFSYGEPVIGRETGMAYLIPGKSEYVCFRVVPNQIPISDDPPPPVVQPNYERPLTTEEIARFETLAG